MNKKVMALFLSTAMVFGAVGSVGSAVASADASQVSVDSYSYSKETVEALNYINSIRSKMGIRELKLDPFLTKAAGNHANYLYVNNLTGHTEETGNKGYTGSSVADRISAVGGGENLTKYKSEVVGSKYKSATAAIDGLINAPLHRAYLLGAEFEYIGVSYIGDRFVANLASYSKYDVDNVYPYENQTNVPTLFDGNENPNPLDKFGVKTSGYVVSFQSKYAVDYTDSTNKFVIKDSKGNVVPHFISREMNGTILMFPKKELIKGEKYTVSVDYTPFSGPDEGKMFNKTWSFTTAGTGSSTTVPTVPSKPSTPTTPSTGGQTVQKYTKDNIGIKLNGSFISVSPKAVVKNGTTFIPLRGVLEKMGASITWNQKLKQVTVNKDDKTIKLTIGSRGAYVNGYYVKLSSAPYVTSSGSTYVPLRFISETLGASVSWDQSNYIVSISE